MTHRKHSVVSLSKILYILCLELVQPKKAGNHLDMAEKMLTGRHVFKPVELVYSSRRMTLFSQISAFYNSFFDLVFSHLRQSSGCTRSKLIVIEIKG